MNDELIMNKYLLLLKSTVEVYVHGTLESSNDHVRQLLKTNLNETMSSQANTYDLMKDNDWYQVDNINTDTINQTLTKLKNKE